MASLKTIKSLLVIAALWGLIFAFVPGYAHAEEEGGFFAKLASPFKAFGDTAAGIRNIVANLIVLIGLIFTGIPIVFAVVAGASYAALVILALVATGIFAVFKNLISDTLNIIVVPGPETVSVVREGWEFSRDFVSLSFIVIVVFIGLATILRIQTYQAQKTLPLLIIMALLVNFSGLLVGFVVDIANLFTNAFLKAMPVTDILTGPLGAAANSLLKSLMEIPKNLWGDDPLNFFTKTFAEPVLKAFAMVTFYFIFIIVLLVVLLLFIVRVSMLWLLTILAPFAFAAYILPATRKIWNQWWGSLIQWAFMGVPMTFFLLLAMKIASIKESIDLNFRVSNDFFGGILISFIGPGFVVLFLVMGFLISITFVPKGAQFITSGAQRGFTAFQKTAQQHAWEARKPITTAMKDQGREMRLGWHEARASGLSKMGALRESVARGWKARPKAPAMGAAAKGTASAFKDSLKAGWGAAIGKKPKKYKKCPSCGEINPTDAANCVQCQHKFS